MSGLLIVALWLALAASVMPKHWWTQARYLLTARRGNTGGTRTPDDHPDLTPVELTALDRAALKALDSRTKWEKTR